jgi:hypothetical protein
MTNETERPAMLQINGWSDDLCNRAELSSHTAWAQRQQEIQTRPMKSLAPRAQVDQRDWRNPQVGWGVVLADSANITAEEKARGVSAPGSIRKLINARGDAPVLYWSPALNQNFLRRYYPDGTAQDLSIATPTPGIGHGCIPKYLLIYGSPTEIPWAIQYALNMSTYVGRLDLEENEGLEYYVDALISDWIDQPCKPRSPLVWSVDHGQGDITWLMTRALANRLTKSFAEDSDLTGYMQLKDRDATHAELASVLRERRPALIVTTSHGMTGPTDIPSTLVQHLGMPVDVNHQPLDLMQLGDWQASGAIWYAHACCSAGSDGSSRYAGLLSGSDVERTLNGVAAAAGARVAPLPRSLLGRQFPLRAFVGHVEPTFDWTLRHPETGEVLTHMLTKALYDDLYQQDRRTPIGYALRGVFDEAGALYGAWQDAINDINDNLPGGRNRALYRRLAAMDRQTLVVLGDPTVALPSL